MWDAWNLEHIKKHAVDKEEAEAAIKNLCYHKKAHSGRYLLVGRSGKRILAVVLKKEKQTVYYLVTARDADKKERERLYEKEKVK